MNIKPTPCDKHGDDGNNHCPECCYRLLKYCQEANIFLTADRLLMMHIKRQSDRFRKDNAVEVFFSKWLLVS